MCARQKCFVVLLASLKRCKIIWVFFCEKGTCTKLNEIMEREHALAEMVQM